MATRQPRVLIAGGGTGGHLFPALAIADEIKGVCPGAEFLFIGTRGKIEARVVPQRGYPFRTIWISGFHRRLAVENLLFPLKVVLSLVQSLFVIQQFQPAVAIGTGGYVCGPILLVASLLRIPTIIHESNSYPGITTRLLASRATKVFIAFETTRRWLQRTDNVEHVGTPTRNDLATREQRESAQVFRLVRDRKTVLVFGGSLGAASINNAVLGATDALIAAGIQLIWQTGQSDYDRAVQALGGKPVGWVGPFIDQMDCAYAAADLVVCRAGATTLAEITRIGKPAVLVPYPHAAADHQTHNARTLVDAGAAVMVPDHEIGERLATSLLELIRNDARLSAMSQASLKLGRPQAGREIAEKILAVVR